MWKGKLSMLQRGRGAIQSLSGALCDLHAAERDMKMPMRGDDDAHAYDGDLQDRLRCGPIGA